MSATDTNKLRARVATLDKLLDDFDGQLDDLLAKSLPETLLDLDTLQQAKLQVTIPYLVYDLVIIYLKTKGIDPRTHPVFRELERVKEYIGKVSKAEKQEPEQQRMTVDKAAADRFIKRAIAQATRAQGQPSGEPADNEPTPGPSKVPVQPVPTGATNKMLAREEWEKQVKAAAEEEEEDLKVFEETGGDADPDVDVEMINDNASAQASLPVTTEEVTPLEQQPVTINKKKKKSKQAKLPLTGAALPATTTTTDTNAGMITGSSSTPQTEINTDPTPENTSLKVAGKKRPLPPLEPPAGDSEDPNASAPAPAQKKRRKRGKKKQNAQVTLAGGGETDGGTTSQSQPQSQSQSRDVSVAPAPQVLTQALPGVETDAAAAGTSEKPRKWRKYNRKKKNANSQPAAETGTRS